MAAKRLLPYYRRALIEIREEAGAKPADIARAIRMNQSAISKFEAGKTGWPRNPERYVVAYAKVGNVDPSVVWLRAFTLMFGPR